MEKSISRILIHAFFGTKDLLPLISTELEPVLYDLIKKQLGKMNCVHIETGGAENHVHIFFELNRNWSVKEVLQAVKGASSYDVNSNDIIEAKFSWEEHYTAFSVSESKFDEVREFIRNQKKIHAKMSFTEERTRLINKHFRCGDCPISPSSPSQTPVWEGK